MKRPGKIWCGAAALGGLLLAGLGGWTDWQHWPASSVQATATLPKHATPAQVLASALEQLHQDALTHFYADPQNGRWRMAPVFEKVVRDWQTPWFSPGELDQQEPIPFVQDMQHIHASSVRKFLAPPPAAGPNAQERPVAILATGAKYDHTKKAWEAKSVDLIGLVLQATPVVYVSEEVAQAHKRGEVPTRPLDDFELAGLQELTKGKDLFGRARDGTIRLLGAVRADASCLRCHDDKRAGDLLGAFSYVLREAQYKRSALGGIAPPADGAASTQTAPKGNTLIPMP